MIKFTLTGYASEEQINDFAEMMNSLEEDKKTFFESYFSQYMKVELERVFNAIANKELEEQKAKDLNDLELQKIALEDKVSAQKELVKESVKEAVNQSVTTEISDVNN